ncbi:kinase-like domain-containing protein [Chytriomyces sp. MP71]|nr:kinase-like domain-containing protein [Chytriomyces sp. MP71]
MIALKNGADSSTKQKSSSTNESSNAKTLHAAATNFLDRLKNDENHKLRNIIVAADTLSDAYIELAFQTPPAPSRKTKAAPAVPIAKNLRLARVTHLPIPVVTADYPVSVSCDYSDLPTIVEFKKEYTLVGGINAPKVLICCGSDGKDYKQLIKGGSDDLRQDATLSNVFHITNILLKKNFETRRRGLSVRTYKVVPLGQRAGVIEWVDNTTPFGEYLTSAHARYRKSDMSSLEARKKMMQEHEREGSTPQSKLQTYLEIESQFLPVFRHFFFESFRDPAVWLVKPRTNYTRSTAVTSIMGWIIGLGDRHPQNTLIDRTTGVIIQIDLGIAFDQGKLLSTPELVPFRLTRDIVDAMGSTGIEGIFRRCCEETLVVARKEANIIYTILDVFRYDPLYNWKGAQSKNRDSVHSGKNIEAERALVGVRRKLSEALSVECQINELFLCAMNKENLSKLYPGW